VFYCCRRFVFCLLWGYGFAAPWAGFLEKSHSPQFATSCDYDDIQQDGSGADRSTPLPKHTQLIAVELLIQLHLIRAKRSMLQSNQLR